MAKCKGDRFRQERNRSLDTVCDRNCVFPSPALRSVATAASLILLFTVYFAAHCHAQDLTPRAYVITPVRANAIILQYSLFRGNVEFAGALPITGATATMNVPALSYYRALGLFGRSANFTASLPYAIGNFQGTVVGAEKSGYRSGLLDSVFRFSINLVGGPAMRLEEFKNWRQTTLLGISFRVVAPTGQYDPTKLVNNGSNRWAFKPELGYSRRRGNWIVDAYGGAWLFTANREFFSHNAFVPGTQVRTESPIGSFEGHLSYNVKPRLWASLDGNFWFGGRTSLNGIENPGTLQRNSRAGVTVSIPLTQRQSVKCSYSYGDYIRYGGNYHNLSIGWQYAWVGSPWGRRPHDDSESGP